MNFTKFKMAEDTGLASVVMERVICGFRGKQLLWLHLAREDQVWARCSMGTRFPAFIGGHYSELIIELLLNPLLCFTLHPLFLLQVSFYFVLLAYLSVLSQLQYPLHLVIWMGPEINFSPTLLEGGAGCMPTEQVGSLLFPPSVHGKHTLPLCTIYSSSSTGVCNGWWSDWWNTISSCSSVDRTSWCMSVGSLVFYTGRPKLPMTPRPSVMRYLTKGKIHINTHPSSSTDIPLPQSSQPSG